MITFLAVIFAFLTLDLVYDDYGSFFTNMASSQYSDFSFIDLVYMGYIGVNHLYKCLYHFFPDYNWMGIGIFVLSILGLYLCLRALKKLGNANSLSFSAVICLQISFAFCLMENLAILSHTRFSLLLCGISLFNLAFVDKINRRSVAANSVLFLIGMLHRPESSIGMLLLISIGVLIHSFDLKNYFKKLWLPILSTLLLFGFISFDWNHTTDFVKKVEPEIEYKLMAKRTVGLSSMTNAIDSVKYEAAMSGMWFDYKTLNTDYLRSLLLPGSELSIEHIIKVVQHVLSFYAYFFFYPALILLLLFLMVSSRNETKFITRFILLQMAAFGITFLLDFNGFLVDNRHFLNIHCIALLISIRYFFAEKSNACLLFCNKQGMMTYVFLFAVFAFCFTVNLKPNNTSIYNNSKCMELTMARMEGKYTGRVVVLTLSNGNITNHPFSFFNKNYAKNKYLIYDMFTYSLIFKYQMYLKKLCNCDASDPIQFFKWVEGERGLYVANDKRFSLTEKYMNLVQGIKMYFKAEDNFQLPNCTTNNEYSDIEIRRVFIEE